MFFTVTVKNITMTNNVSLIQVGLTPTIKKNTLIFVLLMNFNEISLQVQATKKMANNNNNGTNHSSRIF